MHEIEVIEGDLNVRSTDWIQADRCGARFVRLDGYGGAPTAELLTSPLGWIGTSWIMQPPRTAVFPRENTLEWAVYRLENAEAAGQEAPTWLPLKLPEHVAGVGGLFPLSSAGRPRRWAKMLNNHYLVIIEATKAAGTLRYLAVIDGVLLTCRDGEPLWFDDLVDALYHAEEEIS
jgi:hypothetical protein